MKLSIDRYINTENVKTDASKVVVSTKREVKGFASRIKAASDGAATAWKNHKEPDQELVALADSLDNDEGTYVKAQDPVDIIAKDLKKMNEGNDGREI